MRFRIILKRLSNATQFHAATYNTAVWLYLPDVLWLSRGSNKGVSIGEMIDQRQTSIIPRAQRPSKDTNFSGERVREEHAARRNWSKVNPSRIVPLPNRQHGSTHSTARVLFGYVRATRKPCSGNAGINVGQHSFRNFKHSCACSFDKRACIMHEE